MLKNLLVNTLLVASTLAISGCVDTPSAKAISNIETTFKKSVGVDILKNSVKKVAADNKWEIEKETSHFLNLKKSYLMKRSSNSTSMKRASKVEVERVVHINVEIKEHSLKIYIIEDHEELVKGHHNTEQFNEDIEKLEKEIYMDLIHQIL